MSDKRPDRYLLRELIRDHLLDFRYHKELDETLEDIIQDAVYYVLEELTLTKRERRECDCHESSGCGCHVIDYNDAVDDLNKIKENLTKKYLEYVRKTF